MAAMTVSLVNIDGSSAFDDSQQRVESLVAGHNRGRVKEDRFALRVTNTRDRFEIADELARPADLIHVMAHGASAGILTQQRIFNLITMRRYNIRVLKNYWKYLSVKPMAKCIFLDACTTFTSGWKRLLQETIPAGESVVFIGTTRKVHFDECEAYAELLYNELFTARPARAGRLTPHHFKTAHSQALVNYKKTEVFGAYHDVDEPHKSPFRLATIHGTATY